MAKSVWYQYICPRALMVERLCSLFITSALIVWLLSVKDITFTLIDFVIEEYIGKTGTTFFFIFVFLAPKKKERQKRKVVPASQQDNH